MVFITENRGLSKSSDCATLMPASHCPEVDSWWKTKCEILKFLFIVYVVSLFIFLYFIFIYIYFFNIYKYFLVSVGSQLQDLCFTNVAFWVGFLCAATWRNPRSRRLKTLGHTYKVKPAQLGRFNWSDLMLCPHELTRLRLSRLN